MYVRPAPSYKKPPPSAGAFCILCFLFLRIGGRKKRPHPQGVQNGVDNFLRKQDFRSEKIKTNNQIRKNNIKTNEISYSHFTLIAIYSLI